MDVSEATKSFTNWMLEGIASPYLLEIRLTDRCNLKCLSCWQRCFDGKKRKYSELPLSTWLNILRKAQKIGVRELEIGGGGEPLYRSTDLLNVMKLAKELNMKGLLTTNGTLFTDLTIKEIIKMGWDDINFSIDGPDAKTNDYLRGEGSFEKSTATIKTFNSWKKKLNKEKPYITIMPVVSNANYYKLDMFFELAHQLNAQQIVFQGMIVQSELGKKLKLSETQKEELQKLLPTFIKRGEKLKITSNLGFFMHSTIKVDSAINFLNLPLCILPWCYIGISPDGSVRPCPTNFNYNKSFPNALNSSLEDIWQGDIFSELRKKLLNQKNLPSCSNCCPSVISKNVYVKDSIIRYFKSVTAQQDEIKRKDMEITKIRKQMDRIMKLLKKSNSDKEIVIEDMNKKINPLEKELEEIHQSIKRKDMEINKIRKQMSRNIKLLERSNTDKKLVIEDMNKKIKFLEKSNRDKKLVMKAMNDKIRIAEKELDEIHQSISYRIASRISETKVGNLIKKQIQKKN